MVDVSIIKEDSSTENFGVIHNPDFDMANYNSELSKARDSTLLNIRQIPSTGALSIPKCISFKNSGNTQISNLGPNNPNFEPEFASQIIKSLNSKNIVNFALQVIAEADNDSRQLQNLANSILLEESLTETLQIENIPQEIICSILRIISSLFPLADPEKIQTKYSDDLFFVINNLLQNSTDSSEVLFTTISFISVLSFYSAYARDMFIQNEVHIILLQICKNFMENIDLQIICCKSFIQILSNPAEIEISTLPNCIEPLFHLLSSPSKDVLNLVIQSFVELTNRMPSLTVTLFNNGLFQGLIQFLQDEDLIVSCLHLIGNMSLSQADHIQKILEYGLFDALLSILGSVHNADIFWILSNMLESAPYLILPLFSPDFLKNAIEIGIHGSFEVQKEVAFFFSTLIIHTDSENLPIICSHETITLITEMLGCGVLDIIIRCLDSIVRIIFFFSQNIHTAGQLLAELEECDIRGQLDQITEQSSHLIKQRVLKLYHLLDQLDQSIQLSPNN